MSDFSCVITGGGDGEGPGGADALRASVESVLGQSLRGAEAVVVLASTAGPAVRTA
ncbi:CDP-glycerol glycerophosphotransferase, partial [Streptomyces sp. OspMP-M43]